MRLASQETRSYFVTAFTAERRRLFQVTDNAELFRQTLFDYRGQGRYLLHAYVIMPDHFHWLFQLNEPLSVSELVKKIKARSSIAINASMGRQGSVWQRGFHDHALRGDENLRSVARYIVGNPLRAGIVEHIGDYPLWDAIWL